MKKILFFTAGLLLLLTFGNIKANASNSYWELKYRHEYKVRVLKRVPIYKVKNAYLDPITKGGYLYKGEIVRTWYRGVAGVDWQVTGGKFGKANNDKFGYSVNWPSRKSFKILKTYKGTNWF